MPTEAEMFQLLRARYPKDSHALLPHVRDTTGTHGRRTADAIAFGLYPSRGLEVEGFEIKASRNDWLRELKAPEKAQEIFQFCDRWWIVAASDDIVKSSELPPTWGLLSLKKDALVPNVLAPKLAPQPLTLGFIASLLRQVQKESTPNVLLEMKLKDSFRCGIEEGKSLVFQGANRLEFLEKAVADFEGNSGVKISVWNAGKIGSAVAYIMQHGTDRVHRELKWMESRLTNDLRNVKRELKEYEAVFGEKERTDVLK